MDHPPALRIKGMSTQARRCCGASISMAGRRARISLSRSSAASSNTRNLFERDDGDALQGEIDLPLGSDVDGLARVKIARKREPSVASDEAQLGLAVGAGADGGGTDVADVRAFQLESWKELYLRVLCASVVLGFHHRVTEDTEVAVASQRDPRVRLEP